MDRNRTLFLSLKTWSKVRNFNSASNIFGQSWGGLVNSIHLLLGSLNCRASPNSDKQKSCSKSTKYVYICICWHLKLGDNLGKSHLEHSGNVVDQTHRDCAWNETSNTTWNLHKLLVCPTAERTKGPKAWKLPDRDFWLEQITRTWLPKLCLLAQQQTFSLWCTLKFWQC